MLCHVMAFLEIPHRIINRAVFVLGTCSVNIGVYVLVFNARVDSNSNPRLSERSTCRMSSVMKKHQWDLCFSAKCVFL